MKQTIKADPVSVASSSDEESDTYSQQSSSDTTKEVDVPQFSVLRSDSDGLRMKISAIRNVHEHSQNQKMGSSSNNNNVKSNKNSELSYISKKPRKRKVSSATSSSCCSICSRSESEYSSEEILKEKSRKAKIKRKRVNIGLPKEKSKPIIASTDSEPEESLKQRKSVTSNLIRIEQNPTKRSTLQCDVLPGSCASSSDNELPALVSAAIKCVESCSEGESQPSEPSKQYTSTLLRDFMVKTQMLGSNSNSMNKNLTGEESKKASLDNSIDIQSSTMHVKRKRGRPKKLPIMGTVKKLIIPDSADSGITSTAQSLSPSPNSHNKKNTKNTTEEDKKNATGQKNVDSSMQKINLVSLDKQMYATERILYPPKGKRKINTKLIAKQKNKKEDILDPLWKKIDVNTKFRRPSLTGYKSDGGTTICSKILAARSGYVSDYGSIGCRAYSGYKSDVSGKSRFSMRSYVSRAKSCDYKYGYSSSRSRKFRRKKNTMMNSSKSLGNVNEQDILQLAGLSLGQTSEESSRESICKPILRKSESKKYGEINRFVRTGEYFGRNRRFASVGDIPNERNTQLCERNATLDSNKMSNLPQSGNSTYDFQSFSKKIRLRRSSALSRCSSFSTISRCDLRKRRRRRPRLKSIRSYQIDCKLNTEIEILIDSFSSLRLFNLDKPLLNKEKEKNEKEKTICQKNQPKRNVKKRKFSDNSEHHTTTVMLKRRHKRTSPEEHKLPLKKRHYLLAPGEKLDVKHISDIKCKDLLLDSKSLVGRSSTSNNPKITSKAITPKKRHLLETSNNICFDENVTSSIKLSASVHSENKPSTRSFENRAESTCLKASNPTKGDKDIVKKRNRLEGLVSKIQSANNSTKDGFESPTRSLPGFPPPGVFEPSEELEIQIPITELTVAAIVTKSEVDSPQVTDFIDSNKSFTEPKFERVVETLLNRTGGNLLLRKKRRKTNRTGFPSIKKKKRKITIDDAISATDIKYKEDDSEQHFNINDSEVVELAQISCDRVPHIGEASESFLERHRLPRLSVVSLEKLQEPLNKNCQIEISKLNEKIDKKNNEESMNDSINFLNSTIEKTNYDSTKVPIRRKPVVRRRRGRKPWYNRTIKVAKMKSSNNEKDICIINSKEKLKSLEIKLSKRELHINLENRRLLQCNEKKEICNQIDTVNKNMSNIGDTNTEYNKIHKNAKKEPQIVESSYFEDLEQEPLPVNEGPTDSDDIFTSNEKNNKSKKTVRWKKSYLSAGLLSDFYKTDCKLRKAVAERSNKQIDLTVKVEISNLLPPPPYCEKFLRRTVSDFLLPYDIWWAYKNCKLPSRVTVPSWNYKRIRTNVYGDVRPNPAIDHQACNCKPQAACGDDCLNRMVYTECSPSNCPCGEKCKNQKIQKHDIAPGIERFMTENKGWGVRTSLPIKKGMYILEYVGEVVTEKEFKERMATLYVNDTHHYCLHLDGGLVIDGHRMGSDGRFVNHSCSPNCEMQKWSVNGLFRMALFASRNIQAGEELTYDYNFSLFNPSEGQPCRCDTPQCRGVIGGKSQRIKPLEQKTIDPLPQTNINKMGRVRKRQAKKITGRFQSKDIVVSQFQQLTDREKRIARGSNCFLIRNLEKVRKLKIKSTGKDIGNSNRPLTPITLAAQISALRIPRNIKTRGLTQAAHDPEIEKMAKIAFILREICMSLENIKDNEDKSQIAKLLPAFKRKRLSYDRSKVIDFPTIQTNIERGYYKEPAVFDDDINKVFTRALAYFGEHSREAAIVIELSNIYKERKFEAYEKLLQIVPDKELSSFRPSRIKKSKINCKTTEDIIQCICGLFKDEGLMIQCSKCLVWQHAECTKANVNADNYLCERCEPRKIDLEIPLDEYTEEGFRYYLSLLRGNLQIRQSDTVYVLRDIPIKDENGKEYESKKHTYETIGKIDFAECDIFRVERLWKNNEGKRFIFGHHYLRPHETFHEPTRKFYENEVIRVPLYEVVPIELVIARCWVLDRSTFCKGRPVDVTLEEHVYICELRVDKTARFFARAKQSYPTCTKNYAFKKFRENLKISRTYTPHEVNASLIKPKKRKNDETTVTQARRNLAPMLQLLPPPPKTVNEKRSRLENILEYLRKKQTTLSSSKPLDLSYLLTGRGARNRRAHAVNVPN